MHYIRAGDFPQPRVLQFQRHGMLYCLRLVHCTIREVRSPRMGPGPHRHDLYHIVLYSLGNNRFLLGESEAKCAPGTLVLCPPGLPHDFVPRHGGGVIYDEITFELVHESAGLTHESASLTADFGDLLSGFAGIGIGKIPEVTQLSSAPARRIRDMMHRVTKEAMSGSPLSLLRAQSALLDLLVGLSEVLGLETPADSADLMDRAHREILLRYSQPLPILQLADELGLCAESLSRAFKARYGVSPRDFQQDLRLSAAARLLQSSSLSCKEVAARLGFADVQTFTKAFARHFGQTPGRIARALRD